MKTFISAASLTVFVLGGLNVSLQANGRSASPAGFLMFDAGAVSRSMSGAQVAATDNLDAAYWNPASLAARKNRELSVSYLRYFEEMNVGSISFAYPTSKRGTLGASVFVLDSGAIPGTDEFGNPSADFREMSLVFRAGWSFRIGEYALAGAGPKFFRQSVADFNWTGYAMDAGAVFLLGEKVTLGLSALNLGPNVLGRSLPTLFAAGMTCRLFEELLLSGQGDYTREGPLTGRLAADYKLYDPVHLRAGYKISPDELNHFSIGTSYEINDILTANYTFGLNSGVSQSNMISLNWKY